jgi:predicted DNA-binding transcriptional regulator AlpA
MGYGAKAEDAVDVMGVARALDCSRATVFRFRNDASLGFPKPLKLGRRRCVRWLLRDVIKWRDAQPRMAA